MFPEPEQMDGVSMMKMYQQQLDLMCEWFEQWAESGQTMALMKLFTKISAPQARFAITALEDSISSCTDLPLAEGRANSPVFIYNLMDTGKEKATVELLKHVPLLQPGNNRVVQSYLAVVPELLSHCLDNSIMLGQAMQLMVYILIHPALKNYRKNFEHLYKRLQQKIIHTKNQEAAEVQLPIGSNRPLPSTSAPLRPLWAPQSTSMAQRQLSNDLTSGFDNTGMKDVKPWLKSLRLHKYWPHFAKLTYAEMMSLTEVTWESTMSAAGPVTLGARNKILVTISRMRDRYNNLCLLKQRLVEGNLQLTYAMDEVKKILLTPLKPYEQQDAPPVENLPYYICDVLYEVKQQLQGETDDEALTSFVSLLDSAIRLEAFTLQQKAQLSLWRHQIVEYHQQIRNSRQVRRQVPLQVPGPSEIWLLPRKSSNETQEDPEMDSALSHSQKLSVDMTELLDL